MTYSGRRAPFLDVERTSTSLLSRSSQTKASAPTARLPPLCRYTPPVRRKAQLALAHTSRTPTGGQGVRARKRRKHAPRQPGPEIFSIAPEQLGGGLPQPSAPRA